MRETPASLLTRGRQQALTAALLIGEQSAPQLKARPSPHPNRLNLPLYQRPPEWQILEKTPSGLKNHLVEPPSSTQISMTSPANDLPAFACRRPMRRLFMTAHCIFAEVFLVPQIGYTKPSTHPDLPLGLFRGRQIPFQYQSHSIIVPSLL